MLKRFEPQDILFRQGDPSDFAVLILAGKAEVLRQVGDDAIVLGSVEPGDFVGEMGVLDGRSRSATVRAATTVEADLIERQVFLERVSHEPELARKLLVRMSSRLRDVEDMLADLYASQGDDGRDHRELAAIDRAPAAKAPSILLTPQIQGRTDLSPVRIERLPFTVGRRLDRKDRQPVLPVDLAIPDEQPFRLSRTHFVVFERDGEVAVRDLSSTLGTIVNGQSLGRDLPADSAPLHPGDNTIVAGGTGSPFTFVISRG